jgi:hypothetical protein
MHNDAYAHDVQMFNACLTPGVLQLTALRKRRRVEKIKSLGSTLWDHATRTISIPEDYQQYAMVMT